MLSRVLTVLILTAVVFGGCRRGSPEPPEPELRIRVDTVTVEKEVLARLPEARAVPLCLGTGEATEVYLSEEGDTLVGPDRTYLAALRPALEFAGRYGRDAEWFVRDTMLRFEQRTYWKSGPLQLLDCGRAEIAGQVGGINIFVDADAPSPPAVLYVPAAPGWFQPYRPRGG